jgi:hypothetical protein
VTVQLQVEEKTNEIQISNLHSDYRFSRIDNR